MSKLPVAGIERQNVSRYFCTLPSRCN